MLGILVLMLFSSLLHASDSCEIIYEFDATISCSSKESWMLSKTRFFLDKNRAPFSIDLYAECYQVPVSSFETFIAVKDRNRLEALLKMYPVLVHAIVDDQGNTKLHKLMSVFRAKADLIESFYDAGANINAQNDHGKTILHIASELRNFACITVLRTKYNALHTIRDNEGNVPYDYIRAHGRCKREILALLNPEVEPQGDGNTVEKKIKKGPYEGYFLDSSLVNACLKKRKKLDS